MNMNGIGTKPAQPQQQPQQQQQQQQQAVPYSKWTQHRAENGLFYLSNPVTGEVKWLWSRHVDPHTNNDYLVNTVTNERCWVTPQNQHLCPLNPQQKLQRQKEQQQQQKEQKQQQRHQHEKKQQQAKTRIVEHHNVALSSDEVLLQVIETGRCYVFNKKTKSSRWLPSDASSNIIHNPSTPKQNQQQGLQKNNSNANMSMNIKNPYAARQPSIPTKQQSSLQSPAQVQSSPKPMYQGKPSPQQQQQQQQQVKPTPQMKPIHKGQSPQQMSVPQPQPVTPVKNAMNNGTNNMKGMKSINLNNLNSQIDEAAERLQNADIKSNDTNNNNDTSNDGSKQNQNTDKDDSINQEQIIEKQKIDLLTKLLNNVEEMTGQGRYCVKDLEEMVKNKQNGDEKDVLETKQRLLELGEYLTQQMLKVDGVESYGNHAIRLKRKQVVKRILGLTDLTESLNKQIQS